MDSHSIFSSYKTIAIVGVSGRPERTSNAVARYLLQAGYTIYPVNPAFESLFGLQCWPSLLAMPEPVRNTIDIVNIFRKPSEVPPAVDEAIAIGAKVVWMQEGITNEMAADKARRAGLTVIQDKCIAVEHQNARQ